jgi:DtxR family transcriptional regulator, Mn-dependent transcriptional regulator
MATSSEENYLKAIWKLAPENDAVSTNALAELLAMRPASVTDMLKKLAVKKLISYKPYQGVKLTASGRKKALEIVRKHRLWEVFLRDQLGFGWDEVHDIAEQLEHIESEALTDKLDHFLGFPKIDPHGDPIPDKDGKIQTDTGILLANAKPKTQYTVVGVVEHSPIFLRYLDSHHIGLGTWLTIDFVEAYDQSVKITINKKKSVLLSHEVARNLLVTER